MGLLFELTLFHEVFLMNSSEVLEIFNHISVWKSGNERSPNKPLLILLALGKWFNGNQEGFLFKEIENDLTLLLKEFGPSRKTYHPEYPFWHLTNDKIWTVTTKNKILLNPGQSPTRSRLRNEDAKANFSEEIQNALRKTPQLVTNIAFQLLENTFPEILHSDILNSVGLPINTTPHVRQKRDPSFRLKILTLYNFQCAVCGLDIKLLSVSIGLDAAHIRWHNQGGPDTETNGLALCVLHHKIFDLGAFTISPDFRIIISSQANGNLRFKQVLYKYKGKKIFLPRESKNLPDFKYLQWHQEQVFKKALNE
jgi:putative restriction endonuclease